MSRANSILLSFILSLPVAFFILHHYFYHTPELIPTGFTVDENVLYMSYAHQYLDMDHFSFFYANPFDGDPRSPEIYFQPINFIFAAAIKAGINPGLFFTIFGFLMAVLCIYMGIRIIRHLMPGYKHQLIVIVLFTWGGGLSSIAGFIGSNALAGHSYSSWLDGIFLADPANGWWGLNWGRNLFIPLEAFYHFLFLLNIYLILKQKWKTSLLISLFLSVSHPFTGIAFLLIINGWLFIEKIFFRNQKPPYYFWAGILMITAFHGWYYLIYLNNFREHRQLFSQYSAGWTYSLLIAMAAYCLVTALTFLTIFKKKLLPPVFTHSYQRLFLCWAIISFLLSKHEWFIKPMQPIHFTRGYVWSGLFLFSIPGLAWLINYLKQAKTKGWIVTAGVVLFLSDNILWTINLLRKKETVEWEGHITRDTQDVFEFLKKHTTPNSLLVGNSPLVNYMSNVYTSANAWVSHPFNTPDKQERDLVMQQFLKTGVKPDAWQNRNIIIIINKKYPLLPDSSLNTNKIFENNTYEIFTL